jgi:hydrogenase/urease accessory protein HupE
MKETSAGRFLTRWSPPVPDIEDLKLHFSGECQVDGTSVFEPRQAGGGLPVILECNPSHAAVTVSFESKRTPLGPIGVNVEWLDGSTSFELSSGTPPAVALGDRSRSSSVLHVLHQYLVLGVEHIWLGVDHLLFLLGLLLLVRGWRKLLATVTAFTLAHSLTLAAASLKLVALPISPVEICIALSVLLLAVEATRGESTATRRWPWLVAFGFGLLHGLGFASALSEVGLPEDALALSLLGFNLGVELGQVGVVTVVVSAYQLVKQRPKAQLAGERIAVWALGVCSVFWVLERVGSWLEELGVLPL